jgi:hypothetical protein
MKNCILNLSDGHIFSRERVFFLSALVYKLNTTLFWDITPCILVEDRLLWRNMLTPKVLYISMRQHGVTCQTIVLFVIAAVKI